MAHDTINIIRQEHWALSAVLRSMILLLAEHRRHHSLPDFAVLRAMLFYVDEFPERLHHAKESELLFPMLRARSAALAPTLDRLDRDHANGQAAVRNLEHELLGFEMMAHTAAGEQRRERFERAMKVYADFYIEHMRVEEVQVLPQAERLLTVGDWAELDAAFRDNRDPIAGHGAGQVSVGLYDDVFSRIVALVPAPLGLGPANLHHTGAAGT